MLLFQRENFRVLISPEWHAGRSGGPDAACESLNDCIIWHFRSPIGFARAATRTTPVHRTSWPAGEIAATVRGGLHRQRRAIARSHNSLRRTKRKNPESCKDGYSEFHTSAATRFVSSACVHSTATASAGANDQNSEN